MRFNPFSFFLNANRGGTPGTAGSGTFGPVLLRDLQLDAAAATVFTNTSLTTPPASPADGAMYYVNAPATGAWTGHAGEAAIWDGSAWQFEAIIDGAVYSDEATGSIMMMRGASLSVVHVSDFLDISDLVSNIASKGDGWLFKTKKEGYAYIEDSTSTFSLNGVPLSPVRANGTYYVEQFGFPVTEAVAQAAADWVCAKVAGTTVAPTTVLSCSSDIDVADGLYIGSPSGTRMRGLSLDFSQCFLTTVAGGALTATDPAITIQLEDARIELPQIDCGKISSGSLTDDCVNSTLVFKRTVHAANGGYANKHSGVDSDVYGLDPREWLLKDSEFGLDSNFQSDGLVIDGADFRVHGGRASWSRRAIHITENGGAVHFHGMHIFNGRPSHQPGGPRVDPILIESDDPSGTCFFHDCYFDNGIIIDHGGMLVINGGQFLELPSAVTLTHTHMQVKCTASKADQSPVRGTIRGITMSVDYLDDDTGTHSWIGDFSGINKAEMKKSGSVTESFRRKSTTWLSNLNVPAWLQYKAKGAIIHRYKVGSIGFDIEHDPANGRLNYTVPRILHNNWGISGLGADLTISAGAISPDGNFHRIICETGTTDDLHTIEIPPGLHNGAFLTLINESTASTITVKDVAGGVGNIRCGSDRVLDSIVDTITLVRYGDSWRLVSFSSN